MRASESDTWLAKMTVTIAVAAEVTIATAEAAVVADSPTDGRNPI